MFTAIEGEAVSLRLRDISILSTLLVVAIGTASGQTSLTDKICQKDEGVLTNLYNGISGWFAKRAERQSLLSCLKVLCPHPVGIRESASISGDVAIQKMTAEIDATIASHDFGMWADLKTIDEVWRAKLGRFPEGETLTGTSAIAANALLFQSLDQMLGDVDSDLAGAKGNDGKLEIVLKRFVKLSTAERTKIVSNRAKVAEIEKKFYLKDDVRSAQFSMNPDVVRKALLDLWTKNKEALERFRATNPNAFQSQFDFSLLIEATPAIQVLQSGRDIDSAQAESLIYRIARSETWRQIHESPELARSLGEVPRLNQFISARRFVESVIPPKPDSATLAAHEDCRARMLDAAENAPTESEIARGALAVERARVEAIDFWSGRFSKQTSEAAVERIKKTQIRFPPSRKDFAAVLRARLSADRAESAFASKTYRKFLDGQTRSNIIAEGYSLDWFNHSMLASRVVACESSAAMDPAHTTSFAEITANAIQFSTRDIRISEATVPTAAHEFAHVADPEYAGQFGYTVSEHSKGLRAGVASCLKSQHGTDLEDGGYRSIEDFADLNLPTKAAHRITYCSIVKSSKGYFQKESSFDKDHHSPAVFIVLHEAFRAAGKLNEECQAYVSKYKPWKFRDCLENTNGEKR